MLFCGSSRSWAAPTGGKQHKSGRPRRRARLRRRHRKTHDNSIYFYNTIITYASIPEMPYCQCVQNYENGLRQILSANIRAARKRRHLTQTQLALYADLSLSYMTDIERCKTWVSDKTLAKIANALDMSPWELLRSAEGGDSAKIAQEPEQNEAVWRGVRELKRRILLHLNEAIAKALEEHREKDKPPAR
jgi:transcriptional regulator with XRE-family HTH domain